MANKSQERLFTVRVRVKMIGASEEEITERLTQMLSTSKDVLKIKFKKVRSKKLKEKRLSKAA